MTSLAQERTGQGPWTWQALAEATPVDNVRRELIDGWLYIDGQPVDDPMAEVAHESGAWYHGSAVMEMILQLAPARELHVGRLVTAPMDVLFGDRVLQPDVFWVPGDEPIDPSGRAAPAGRTPDDHFRVAAEDRRYERPIAVTPSLTVEVSSPSTRRHDLVRKRRVYEEAGVVEYWFVDLDAQRFETYRLVGDRYDAPALHLPGVVLEPVSLLGVPVDVATVLGVS